MTEYIGHEEKIGNVTLKVIQDTDPMSPLEWDNAGTMVCDHGRYDLGHSFGHKAAREAVRASKSYSDDWEDSDKADSLDLDNPVDLWTAVQRCEDIISFPLYLYDHSGITIRMSTPFDCKWDSGQVGYIFITMEKARSEFSTPTNTNDAWVLSMAESCLDRETETYDKYLTGDIWGYVVEDSDGETLDSCWGYFGLDDAIEQGREGAKSCDTQGMLDLGFGNFMKPVTA
jgi:hypothetical protein